MKIREKVLAAVIEHGPVTKGQLHALLKDLTSPQIAVALFFLVGKKKISMTNFPFRPEKNLYFSK